MCIALLSTAHPAYSLVLIDNRDEFLDRPTAQASWWPEPDSHVLGGRDLLRPVHGTWLGVTKQGRIAVLTNFKEDSMPPQGLLSRGNITRLFLTGSHTNTENFVREMIVSGASKDAGGFSLICGNFGEPLAVMSNRAASEKQIPWIHPETAQTVGLSNAAYGDRDWKKVTSGEDLLAKAIRMSVESGETQDDFIQRLITLLSTDTMTRIDHGGGGGLEKYIPELKNTIFVPVLGRQPDLQLNKIAAASKHEPSDGAAGGQLGVSGLYGTQKQTVVLVEYSGRVRFFERTVIDSDGRAMPHAQGDRDFVFDIER
jgi:uncharacterized protein with NRDE domain